jgi:hypothetical protein
VSSRHIRTRYVVVVLGPDGTMVPDVVGPYLMEANAELEAKRWMADPDFVAQVRPIWAAPEAPALRRRRGVKGR